MLSHASCFFLPLSFSIVQYTHSGYKFILCLTSCVSILFFFFKIIVTTTTGCGVCVCLCVCMFVQVSMQDNKGRVGSLSFPSYFLCSTLCFIAAHCPLFPPSGTPHTHTHTLTCTKHAERIWQTFSCKHFEHKQRECHAGCNSLNSAANTPFSRDSGSYTTYSICSYNLHIHSNLFACCLDCRVFGPFDCKVDCEVSMMKQAHTERLWIAHDWANIIVNDAAMQTCRCSWLLKWESASLNRGLSVNFDNRTWANGLL